MAIRTITLKLHKPGKRKRNIIENAMRNYSSAYQHLLDRAFNEIEEIREQYRGKNGGYRANRLAKWVDKDLSRELNRFNVEPFKDSLKIDFGMTIAGYLNLREIQHKVGYPIAYISEADWLNESQRIIEEYEAGLKTCAECEKEIKRIIDKSSRFKPIFFCRYAVNRDYSLVYDSSNNRYYAKLYLLNVKSEDRNILKANNNKKFWHIYKDNKMLENSGRRERYILFPLSFGKWQESFLKEAFERPEMLKTARLLKKKDEFYLAVNVEIEETEKIKTNTFLGIARALSSSVHYTVIDSEMKVVDKAHITCLHEKKKNGKNFCINDIHEIANSIVNIASQNQSQVIVESLVSKGDRLKWVKSGSREAYVPVLNCYNYNRLTDVLAYKLKEKGLPPPVKVSPVKIFYTCPKCGLSSRMNRFSKDLFICTSCGLNAGIETLGSLNLARKLCEYKSGALKVKIERTEGGTRFTNDILELDLYVNKSEDYQKEFVNEVNRIIREFYDNIGSYTKNSDFRKKYSLIKKIQEENDILKLLRIDL
jgi:putative transposase